jgi:hypothetical protein
VQLISRALALMDHPLDSSDQLLAAHGGKVLQRIIAVCPRRVLDSPRFPDLVTQASYKVRASHTCAEAIVAVGRRQRHPRASLRKSWPDQLCTESSNRSPCATMRHRRSCPPCVLGRVIGRCGS